MGSRVSSSRRNAFPSPPPAGTQSGVDRGTVNAGLGPYALSQTYVAGTTTVTLDGVEQLPANYTIVGTALTFVGLTMANYATWSVRGNY